ncbi:ATP-binding cassette domain-containing protein [Gemella sp. zg-570]|uniref:ATP-binding cassette domain-containing protein n=1 Tax=Gemella sp. zg-570 TaxID=2840371 RepID=UPI001C0B5F14|nr:ATP-binding cassette domain-containing protein [Gemella sp. zg-570]QWQ39169.1 ATP-binding cassette domain-containing protein [Gemella sp. zg-570]
MVIQIKNISKNYPNSNFQIKNISFDIKKNDVLGLIGSNGSGKSTILKMINGLVSYDKGKIIYNNKNLDQMNEKELREMRKNVVYIFQDNNLLDGKTVFYHLSLIYKLNKEKVNEAEINKILKFMNIENLKNITCRNLSGGQKQKVAIAMALLQNPKVILCDEISSALDSSSEKEIFDLLIKLKKTTDISIVLISHNLSILKNFCDKVILLGNSTIKEIIVPNKNNNMDYEKDYFKHIKEFLLDD